MGQNGFRVVEDYLTFGHLNSQYNPEALQSDGIGFRVVKDDVVTLFAHSGQEMRFISYIGFGPGQTRGNHYHRVKTEHMCVIAGTVRAEYYLPGDPSKILERRLSAGETVQVEPGCVHTYTAEVAASALEFSPQEFDDSDTIRMSNDSEGCR